MKPQTAPIPEPTWKFRVENEAKRKVQDLQVELEAANTALRAFRMDHCVVLGTQMFFKCGSIDGRAELDREWHALVTHRDQLLQKWNQALAEFAEVKSHT